MLIPLFLAIPTRTEFSISISKNLPSNRNDFDSDSYKILLLLKTIK